MERIAQITVEFAFEASHQLHQPDWSPAENEAVFGNCARLHGHSYRLLVTLRGPIDPATGMVRNFRDVKQVVRERVIRRMDHHHLNDLVGNLSTAENLVYWIAAELLPVFGAELHRILLWETATACAILEGEDLHRLLLR
ncbi:MAG: 6-carboxytetrahydropterin synthase [SAR202 cluster bacterium]|nr:6-carboxytetrahydropterin synthase [SAR202 cluster bacterium]